MIKRNFLVCLIFLAAPPLAQAQWSSDPAQAGATAYCASRNQGQSIEQAEQAATQATAEILQLAAGPLVAALQVNNPVLVARWRYLVQSLCPESGSSAGQDDDDDGL
jgi:hypothetical protein